MIFTNPPRKKIISLISEYLNENEFDIEVILECIKATDSIIWNDDTINWFYRMDFIPANWEKLFKLVCQSIFWK